MPNLRFVPSVRHSHTSPNRGSYRELGSPALEMP
jgi:hypothetical protein